MSKFIEMQVDSIRVHMPSGQHVVILKEKDAERFLPIWIGIYEANAIALKITNITPERPITHDLLANIRPSDAIALAVRLTCPILVAQEVLDKAGVLPEKEEDEEKLTVFKDLVNNMDLPDLGEPPKES
jgi:bifunctional DNase/RNase